jgi:hypothetical protein
MDKCSECGVRCNENPIALEFAGERQIFCSFECLITHSVANLRRRIASRNKRVQRYVQAKIRCQSTRARRAAKVRLSL